MIVNDQDRYLAGVLSEFSYEILGKAILNKKFITPDGTVLFSTQVRSPSEIGIVIVPGLTIPRECYFRLITEFSDLNLMIFDIRSQSLSGGNIEIQKYIDDINFIGAQLKKNVI